MTIIFESNTTSITAQQLENIHLQLMSDSVTYYNHVQAIIASGVPVKVSIGSGFPNSFEPETKINAYNDGSGYDAIRVNIPISSLMGTTYDTSSGSSPLTLERVLAHEVGGHVWQAATLQKANDSLPFNAFTNAAFNDETISESFSHGKGAEYLANAIMWQSHQEASTIEYGFESTIDNIIRYYGTSSNTLQQILIDNNTGTVYEVGGAIDEVSDLFDAAEAELSPLVLDLDGDGIETTSVTGSSAVYFDHDQDGFAETSGWVAGGDGILGIDLNQDGVLNNGAELFGNQTGQANGFEALKQYDSNQDGKISSEDVVWNDLKVWVDANGDGVSKVSELKTLDELEISEINLSYASSSATDNGNAIKQTGSFVIDGATRNIGDVYFSVDKMNTIYNEDIELDRAVFSLPTLRGYGELAGLSIAMTLDNSGTGNLLDLVKNFTHQSFADLFAGNTGIPDAVKTILFRWAGVEDVNPASRGAYADAQELEFLEKLMGQDFLQGGLYSDPGAFASYHIKNAFDLSFNHLYANLMAQTEAKELFTGDVTYDFATDHIEGITGLDLTKLDDLETEASALGTTGAKEIFWANVVRMIEYTVGVDNLSSGSKAALESAITSSAPSLLLDDIVDSLTFTPINTTVNGTTGSDALNGGSGDDRIYGNEGHDILNGLGGNDTIEGGIGNDTLTGSAGGDLILGGQGDDTYVYNVNDGFDLFEETSGTDKIQFGAGIDLSDLTFTRVGRWDLVIDIDTGSSTGQIIIQNQFANGQGIESILFNGGATFNLATQSWTVIGTSGNDTLYGAQYGASQNDILYGGDGNDTLWGLDGNDTLYGENGSDTIYAGYGNDTIYGGAGNDHIEADYGDDTLDGGTGDDTLNGYYGNDTYIFNSGNDTIIDNSGTDSITLAAGFSSGTTAYYKIGDDMKIVLNANNSILIKGHFGAFGVVETLNFNGGPTINLTTVSYTLQGDDGNNTLTGTSSDNTFYGMGGNDTLSGNDGNDTLDGGSGNDSLYGGYGLDVIYGGLGDDYIEGNQDNDYMDGGAGNDTLKGGAGNDTYYYISGNDFFSEGNSGTAADVIQLAQGYTLDNLTFYRKANNDLVIEFSETNKITVEAQFHSSTWAMIETLKFADNSTVALNSLQYETYGTSAGETIYGITTGASSLNDVIYALGGNDSIYAGDGNDFIYGGDGNDYIEGNNGADYLDGGSGNDTLKGGSGNDTYYYSAGLDTLQEVGAGDIDKLMIGGGKTINDISITASGYNAILTVTPSVDVATLVDFNYSSGYQIDRIEFDDGFSTTLTNYASWIKGTASGDTLSGTSGHDTIIGYAGNDTLNGAGGDDDIHGGIGDDIIKGGDGVDVLHGGVGNDEIWGEAGLDTLYGGAGADTFVFKAASAFGNIDTIKDFSANDGDKLHISDLLIGYTPGTSDINDFVSFSVSGSNTSLVIDRDGAGTAHNDQNIATLSNVTGLVVDDLFNNNQIIV